MRGVPEGNGEEKTMSTTEQAPNAQKATLILPALKRPILGCALTREDEAFNAAVEEIIRLNAGAGAFCEQLSDLAEKGERLSALMPAMRKANKALHAKIEAREKQLAKVLPLLRDVWNQSHEFDAGLALAAFELGNEIEATLDSIKAQKPKAPGTTDGVHPFLGMLQAGALSTSSSRGKYDLKLSYESLADRRQAERELRGLFAGAANTQASAEKSPEDFNHDHSLFSEIRCSMPVNEDDEPTRYIINEAQLQRIRVLEFAHEQSKRTGQVELEVWYDSMPESCGRVNWTAILHRKGGCISDGVTIARSEYPDRVRYEADCYRYVLGLLPDKPFLLNYDTDKRSDYVYPPTPQKVALDQAQAELAHAQSQLEKMRVVLEDAVDDAKSFLASDQGWTRYGNQRDEIAARYDAVLAPQPKDVPKS